MATEAIAEYLATLPAFIEELQRMENEYVPSSVERAVHEQWGEFMSPEFRDLFGYDEQQRLHDQTRVIPLSRAFAILQAFEDAIVEREVVTVGQHVWKDFRAVPIAIKLIVDDWAIFYEAVKAAMEAFAEDAANILSDLINLQFSFPSIDVSGVVNSLNLVWSGICTAILKVISIKRVQVIQKDTLADRDRCIAALRKAAFPQRHAKRCRRRKRTRR